MDAPLPLDSVVVASADQLSAAFPDEVVILALRDSMYYGLAQVGARVWSLLESPRTIADIVNTLVTEYAVSPEQAVDDVRALVEQLHAHGLVELRSGTGA